MKNIYFIIYIFQQLGNKKNAWAWNRCLYWESVCRDPRGKKHKGWRSCGDGWSEVWTAGCVEDLCADGLRRRAWSRGGGQDGEGGEVAGDRTCSRPLSDPLRRSLVPPSALRPLPLTAASVPVVRGAAWETWILFQRNTLKSTCRGSNASAPVSFNGGSERLLAPSWRTAVNLDSPWL